ncbi:hypothetical protein Q834_04105 [Listeria monocytogenes]|nr:hypothetical protein [Listeria monocytogenes]
MSSFFTYYQNMSILCIVMFHWKNKVVFIAKLVKAKIFIHDIKIKLEEINSQFRNKKNYQPATHTK